MRNLWCILLGHRWTTVSDSYYWGVCVMRYRKCDRCGAERDYEARSVPERY